MNTDNPYTRFKIQFDENEWATLNSNFQFKTALAADDYDTAAELAARILIGETKSISEGRKMKKEYNEWQKVRSKFEEFEV